MGKTGGNMKTVLVRRGQENTVHIGHIALAKGSNTTWDMARLIVFAAQIGAKRIPGTDQFRDNYGWTYRLGDSK